MSGIHPITLAVLRHLMAHGPCTRDECAAAVGEAPGKTFNNLRMLGHIVSIEAKPLRYSITPRGRERARFSPKESMPGAPKRAMRQSRVIAEFSPPPPPTPMRERAPPRALYQSDELGASPRPGAMEAFRLPSRVGNRLHWPDGRTTPIDHPTTGENSHG